MRRVFPRCRMTPSSAFPRDSAVPRQVDFGVWTAPPRRIAVEPSSGSLGRGLQATPIRGFRSGSDVVIMTAFAPPEIIGIAYDSGGVTTSTVTVPLVTALGVGLASSIKGRSAMTDGFGLIAFASLTPMIFVMAYGMVMT